jgi:toxin ParE1/3/4
MLTFSEFVDADLESISDYIARDSPARAVRFIRKVRARLLLIGEQPLLYQLRPDIGQGIRIAVIGRYVILFEVAGDTVMIERIMLGQRDLSKLF